MKKILITLLIFSCVFIKLTSQEKSRPKFYIGTDMGYAGSNINEIGYSGGLEITPYFGIAPFRYVPDLSFEVAVQMDFIGNCNPNTFDFRFRNITPQILACYKFNFIFVKPYIKTGVGININSGDFIYNDYQNHKILVCEYVSENEKVLCGAITCIFENEPDYEPGYDVKWINREPYLTIHRVAVKKEFYGKGVASRLFNKAFELCKEKNYWNVKIDTHEENYDMKKLLNKFGFVKCGIIKLRKKGEFREAFQKVIE